MKRIIIIISLVILPAALFAQPRVNISLVNPAVTGTVFHFDVKAEVLAGQSWRVGSSNIRVDWSSVPVSGISVKPDNPVISANPTISANSNYAVMTTTSISGGTAISLNITRLANCQTLLPGTYILGKVRFNIADTASSVTMTIRTNSVLQDSITQLSNPSEWILTNPAPNIVINTVLSIVNGQVNMPTEYAIYQNYPNPFNPETTIKYDIPYPSDVRIAVYNMLGKEVAVLVSSRMEAGRYSLRWNASSLASGVYFYTIRAAGFSKTHRMMLVK